VQIQSPTVSLDDSTVQRIIEKSELIKCYPAIKELRPHLSLENFIAQSQKQFSEGYALVALRINGAYKSVAGYRFVERLAYGKILYIDDLITPSTARGNGYGSTLLNWIIAQAKVQKCMSVHLDTGFSRHDAHRLYLNHGFKISTHHMMLTLP